MGAHHIIPPSPETVADNCQAALREDIGSGDLTAELIAHDCPAHAKLICRESAVLCGCAWVEEIFSIVDPKIDVQWARADGDAVSTEKEICTIHGPARSLLTAERSAINFLQTLSATATVTRRFVAAIAHTKTRLLDTRKTLPGLRQAQKYAVRCGGGYNHRMGLYDGVLVKENHIIATGSIEQAVKCARACREDVLIVVEVEDLQELEQACVAGADRALLDNFYLTTLRQAVVLSAGRLKLEASGNITLENISEIAETGVDFISVGALTKNIRAIDFSLRFQ